MKYIERLKHTNNEYWAAFETHIEMVVELEATYNVPGEITKGLNELMIDAIEKSRQLEALLNMPIHKRIWYQLTKKEF